MMIYLVFYGDYRTDLLYTGTDKQLAEEHLNIAISTYENAVMYSCRDGEVISISN